MPRPPRRPFWQPGHAAWEIACRLFWRPAARLWFGPAAGRFCTLVHPAPPPEQPDQAVAPQRVSRAAALTLLNAGWLARVRRAAGESGGTFYRLSLRGRRGVARLRGRPPV